MPHQQATPLYPAPLLTQEEPDVPFTEEDYRRRRPHPNFKEHIAAEKLVIKLGKTEKTKFTSYVVAAGLTYGEGESIFHFLFKVSDHTPFILVVECVATGCLAWKPPSAADIRRW